MNERRLTPERFDSHVREKLRYGHGFEHADLERAKGMVSDAISHVEKVHHTSHGMGAEHLDTALKFLKEKHPGWKGWAPHKQAHVEAALKEHFGIEEEKESV